MTEPRAAPEPEIAVALLTAGTDKHYTFGLATSLAASGVALEVIGGSANECPEFHHSANIKFFKLRGSQTREAPFLDKAFRIVKYYLRLIAYSARARPKLFHILWNNRFEFADRVLLMGFYRLLGKKVVLTAHNVNKRKRDRKDSALNRLTLRIQYRLTSHIFVHTPEMKSELTADFGVREQRITVIPFGINNFVAQTDLTAAEARERLGIRANEKAILFFGRIEPYKGLPDLAAAFRQLQSAHPDYRLIVAGRPDAQDPEWGSLAEELRRDSQSGRALVAAEFIPDHAVEAYFKAADVLVLPYRRIYQSGVLFLAFSFGLPVLAADLGAFRDEIRPGENGFLFRPGDPLHLARTIEAYFESGLYAHLDQRRPEIRRQAQERNSWTIVAAATRNVYAGLLKVERA